ncbi:uncharacterized protein LOC132750782 [Ruditapes philippinarum]|uniref:uncharacterized protein LOC132750782 n=1 Tax=Ruditapes philippinarum TaxID=129788 RepID=UPI00295BDF82|nr:uncharacterized protein LOC132750782 [Ruditapes philippinarum]
MKTKRDQEHEKYLKDKDLQVAAEKIKLARAERDLVEQWRQAKQDDNDKILRIKELELQTGREQCIRDDMKTKRDEEHEKYLKYLKDKDLEIAAEKRKTEEKRAKAEIDLVEQRRQATLDINDKILKIKEKELQVGMQQKINEERRSSNERQAMKMKHDHEIKLKKLEMEQQAKSAKLEERKIRVEENKANNMKDLLAILKHKNQR